MACRVICNLHKTDHVNPVLNSLNWLKIEERILYKIVMLAYKCKIGSVSPYLIGLLPHHEHGRQLQPGNTGKMLITRYHTALAQDSSFRTVTPCARNQLPTKVTDAENDAFKRNINT